MQQFMLDDQLEVICFEDGREYAEIVMSLLKSCYAYIRPIRVENCQRGRLKMLVTMIAHLTATQRFVNNSDDSVNQKFID